MKIGFLHSIIRKEEKLLLEEFRKRKDVELVMIDDRDIQFTLGKNNFGFDIVLERSINHSRALHALRIFESVGVKCINTYHVANICGDKLLTILTVDFGQEKWNLEVIDELYKLVSLYSGREIPVNRPIVGANAFTHCAGIHTQAAIQDPTHYDSIDPKRLGRRRKISLDHMSGVASITYMLKEIGESNTNIIPEVLSKVKEIGRKGRTVSLDEFKMIVNFCKDNQINRAISNMGE